MGAASIGGSTSGGGKRRRRRAVVMSEINVTPFVDVMLVLLIIFMVAAPLMTVGVPIDLPRTQARSVEQDKDPLTISIDPKGQIFIQNSQIGLDELVPRLEAITKARSGLDERIVFRGDKELKYSAIMQVLGRLNAAGYRRVALMVEFEQGT